MSTDRVATIERRLSALTWRFAQAGAPLDRRDPHIATVLAGIRRAHGRPPRGKDAINSDDLRAMLATLHAGSIRGARDRAMLLIGFAGGFRRAELTGLDAGRGQTEDGRGRVDVLDQGLLVTCAERRGGARSRSDQDRASRPAPSRPCGRGHGSAGSPTGRCFDA